MTKIPHFPGGSVIFLCVLLVSCADVQQVEPPTISPPAELVKPVDLEAERQKQEQARRHRLRVMLASAQRALADDRLMVPESDNAFSWYQQVLDVDEANAEAHWGMLQITERYLLLAKQSFTSGRRDKAELMLARALRVAATPEQIDAVRKEYNRPPADNEFLLSPAELSRRSDTMRNTLYDLAQKAKVSESRMMIVARNDAEGRWVYQQMREAIDGYRLRGNIEIGSVPRVVLIDLGVNNVSK